MGACSVCVTLAGDMFRAESGKERCGGGRMSARPCIRPLHDMNLFWAAPVHGLGHRISAEAFKMPDVVMGSARGSWNCWLSHP